MSKKPEQVLVQAIHAVEYRVNNVPKLVEPGNQVALDFEAAMELADLGAVAIVTDHTVAQEPTV